MSEWAIKVAVAVAMKVGRTKMAISSQRMASEKGRT